MGKRNKKDPQRPFFLSQLKDETRRWIFSIFSFLCAIFFSLAYIGKAGVVGDLIQEIFSTFFGIGYFLFPIFFVGLTLNLLFVDHPRFMARAFFGGILFIVSGLAFVGVVSAENAGIVGVYLSSPFTTLFDVVATKIILIGLTFISLLIFFDATPSKIIVALFSLIRRKKVSAVDASSDEETIADTHVEETESSPQVETENYEEDTEEIKEKKTGIVSQIVETAQKTERHLGSLVSAHFFRSKKYTPPPLSLLQTDRGKPGVGDIKANANIIKRTLQNFGISVEMDEISVGPSITRYALKPAQGIKLSRIVGLQNDLSLALAAHPIRIEAPIPGKSLVGIEIPNSTKTTVGLGSLLGSEEMKGVGALLAFPIGRSIAGNPIVGNLNKMPHLLIAGATGSGKSVTIHSIVTSLLYRNSPAHMRFIMIDPKRTELTLYNTIPHLLTPVITDYKKAILSLKWAAKEMDRRYDILETESVRDIESYHKNIVEPAYTEHEKEEESNRPLPEMIPYIVIIIDELADIMSAYPRELESALVRIAQMSRAVGIHLILSTQRPEVNIITGLIKANIPARIALQVSSQIDSRTILDIGGAEKLLGSGDMLYLSGDMSKPVRLQSAYIGESEIKQVVTFLSKQHAEDESSIDINFTEKNAIFDEALMENLEQESGDDDTLYEEARSIVIQTKKASTTYLQRKLKIGYARAARIMDMLEERGIIGRGEGAKPREVLVSSDAVVQNVYGEEEEDEKY
ncbi:MAG: DNA translocase FtsK [bacterium]|nr:DNA translocase FtsK [bacterium]